MFDSLELSNKQLLVLIDYLYDKLSKKFRVGFYFFPIFTSIVTRSDKGKDEIGVVRI